MASLRVLLGMLSRSLCVQSRNFLLGPLKVVADFSRIAHSLGEAFTSSRKAGLSLLLQLQELAVLGVEFAGSLCLNGHAPVKRDRVKGVGEAVLHILLEVDAASGAGAFVVAARATDIASRSSRVARGNTRGGAHGLIAFWGRAGVLAVSGVLGGL